jgi:SAM-dependent methyltransferase
VEAVGGDPLPPAAEFAQEIVHSGDPWYVIDVALPAQPSAGYSPQPPRRRRSSGAAAPAPAFHDLPEARIVELTDYVIRRTAGLDDSLLPYGDPAGKDVLVFGAGYGADTLWATQRQARSILSTDVSPGISPVPFERALERLGIDRPDYEFRRESVHETVLTGETFDLIISRDVFEHVHDLKGTLASFRPLLRPGGRIAIYADSLWYSSLGGHIHAGPWEHLYRTPWELREELTPYLWDVWCNKLNRMTITDFVEAIRSVGLIILQLRVIPDPNIRRLPELLPRIRERMQVTPTDLSILSIGCELCFEENL